MILLQQMLLFAVMMLIGYFMARKGIFTKEVTKAVSWMVLNVANPALILSGCIGGSPIGGKEILKVILLAFAVYAVLIVASWGLSFIVDRTADNRGLYQAMLIFSNMGFMGVPLMAAVYGSQSVIYISMFLIPFNLIIYTYGVFIIKDEKKPDNTNAAGALLKVINPGVIAGIVSLVFCLTGWKVTGLPVSLADSLGAITGPLSMMVIGASFLEVDMKKLLVDWKLYLFSFLRLILIPYIGMIILMRFVDGRDLLGACYVVLAAPVASMTVMFSKQYRKEDMIATKAVALSTLLSVVTMPLLLSLLGLS